MSTHRLSLALLASALLLVSCAHRIPYRETGFKEESADCHRLFKENDSITKGEGTIADNFAESPCWLQSSEEHTEYDLLTVEFSDQGWLQGEETRVVGKDHIDLLLDKLEAIYNENQENGLSIVLYVHGWHHNARPDDRDVVKLRKFLGEIKAAENGRPLAPDSGWLNGTTRKYAQTAQHNQPRVVGIFVGWRGESIESEGLNYLTFWNRKSAAEQVASGSVRELLQQLDFVRDCGRTGLDWKDMRRRLSAEDRRSEPAVGYRNVRMLTVGHSFGGLIAYRGLSSEFIGHAVRASEDEFVSRMGDLVVFVNPAYEGARYEPLHAAGRRIQKLKGNQLPTVITVTSRADDATGVAFPAARWLYTFLDDLRGAERDAVVKAVGHNDRYRTHELDVCDATKDQRCLTQCKASELEPDPKALTPVQVRRELAGQTERMRKLAQDGIKPGELYLCEGLKLKTEDGVIPTNNPFWVVSTSKAIMDGHNDVFNPNLIAFVRQMYLAVIVSRLEKPTTSRCVR